MPRSFSPSLTGWYRVALALAAVCVLVRPANAADVSFRNDVMAVLSKSGCNLGTCHGNARGKGGFQISLRGQDPVGDYKVLTRDWSSRRANVSEPNSSLMLLKPTQQIAHEGGKRFETDSAEYRMLHKWIAAGMPNDSADAPKLVKLNVTPREAFLSPVPSPQPVFEKTKTVGERARVRGPNGDDAPSKLADSTPTPSPRRGGPGRGDGDSGAQTTQSSPLPNPPHPGEGTKRKTKDGRTPHPNPLPSKARGEGTRQEAAGQANWQLQLNAKAEFSDGSTRDVTTLAVYEVAQPIADVSHDGLITGRSVGETTILVRYLNQQIGVRVAFIPERPDFARSKIESANFIDELVFAKLDKLRMNPSDVCDDATFVRRVHLDLLGLLPTAEEARAFVTDRMADKREKLIDLLLERPEFADWWALKWSDLLRIEEKTLDRKGVENFHGWLRDCFATNKPLDQMIREIVAGRGSTYEVPPANFYRALRTPFERSEAVGQLFLGVRLQCSKCHNHPFDRWTQDDYYSWGSVFARVDYKIIENRRRDNNDKHEFDGEQIVFLSDDEKTMREAKDPRTEEVRPAKFLGERLASRSPAFPNAGLPAPEGSPARGQAGLQAVDPLDELAEWLTDPSNDRFVQMLANRTWQQIMGRGIVDPVDDFRATNPAANPALLKALADEFCRMGTPARPLTSASRKEDGQECPSYRPFDLRHLLRVILNSKTYQLSSEPNDTNREDEANFSRSLVRRLTAKQLLDATSQVCDVPLDFTGYPRGPRAAQLPGVSATRRRDEGPSDADRFLKLFGKPPRLQSCDCERSDETTLGQTFQLVSGSLVNRLLSAHGNRLEELLNSKRSTVQIVTQLYWTALTRPPTSDELREATKFLDIATNRRAALEDVTWGLLNSHEFLLRR